MMVDTAKIKKGDVLLLRCGDKYIPSCAMWNDLSGSFRTDCFSWDRKGRVPAGTSARDIVDVLRDEKSIFQKDVDMSDFIPGDTLVFRNGGTLTGAYLENKENIYNWQDLLEWDTRGRASVIKPHPVDVMDILRDGKSIYK